MLNAIEFSCSRGTRQWKSLGIISAAMSLDKANLPFPIQVFYQ